MDSVLAGAQNGGVDWLNALTLAERAAAARSQRRNAITAKVNSDLARRRLDRWKGQPPFMNEAYFNQLLEANRLTEEQFLQLLGESSESIYNRLHSRPAWMNKLERAFSGFDSPSSNGAAIPKDQLEKGAMGFSVVTEPLIRRGVRLLNSRLGFIRQSHSALPIALNKIEELFLPNLLRSLVMVMTRTMVLELNVARLQGVLQGQTPEERFHSFLERLRQPEAAIAILKEYPVLARQLVTSIDDWVRYSLEFLRRLCGDLDSIRTMFTNGEDPGELAELTFGAGDLHRQGQSVAIVTFSSGFKLVYKPRSLRIDIHFAELLTWLNERGAHPAFFAPKILDRKTYGWSEFISAKGCASQEEISRFYERQGAYLAVLYMMEAADFHFENLIAAGEHPVLIDLEALFHPRLSEMHLAQQAQGLAVQAIGHSVMRVGLLPQRLWANNGSEGVDLSGLGGMPGQLTPIDVPGWEAAETDEMRLVFKRMEMPGSHNRPNLNGAEIQIEDYTDELVTGFTSIYRLLQKRRDELLSDDGPLARFAKDEVRAILRPSQAYAVLLSNSYHPDMLRNALDRDRLLDRLWAIVPDHPEMAKVILAEQSDLRRGDIPFFTSRPDSRDLWTSTNKRIVNFFDEPCINRVRQRLENLGEDDLSRQIWFIRASLSTLTSGKGRDKWVGSRLKEPETVAEPEDLLEAAREVGEKLDQLALRQNEHVAWITACLINERAWSLLPTGLDLYSGLPGIALFLAYLGDVTGEDRYTALAKNAVASLTRLYEERQAQTPFVELGIGAFSGLGGLIYVWTHLAMLWQEPGLLAQAESIVELLPNLIEEDEDLDLIGGAAGCARVLINLYRATSSRRALAAAIQCGDRLIAKAQPMSPGIGWAPRIMGARPLTGYSHGAAGMADALLDLASLTGERRFREAGLEAIAYERSQFKPELDNWPDFRESDLAESKAELRAMTAWCHGAPGIGLARLRLLSQFDDAEVRREIEIALKNTLNRGFGLNHSLCHGDLGNLELLLEAGIQLGDPQRLGRTKQIATMILESIKEHGWICGIPLGVETPGLMDGLAGIGYGLLRSANPSRVPSVLTLAPPRLVKPRHEQTYFSS